MAYTLQATNLTLSSTDQELLEKKLSRLLKLCPPAYSLEVKLAHDAHHRRGDVISCILNLTLGKNNIHVTRIASSIQIALDEAIAAVKKSLLRQKTKYT